MNCERTRGLIALSAAGLLDAGEQRQVMEHVRDCSACAEELAEAGAIAGALSRLPLPQVPAGLVYRTQTRIAIEADRRQGARLAIAAGVLSWLIAIAMWRIGPLLGGSNAAWIWMVWYTVVAGIGSAAVAVLAGKRRLERMEP
jgi:anti-sigma factor RsiW